MDILTSTITDMVISNSPDNQYLTYVASILTYMHITIF